MWNHSFAMSDAMREQGLAWPRFENSEMADLIAFLYFLSFSDPLGDPAQGMDVFAERGCDQCHARTGMEGEQARQSSGPLLEGDEAASSAAGLVAAMWNHAPVMRRAILGEGLPWPELSGQDLRNLRAYLLAGTVADAVKNEPEPFPPPPGRP